MAKQAAGTRRKIRTRSGRKWLIIIPVFVGAGAALAASALQDPVYSASAEVLIQPRAAGGLFADEATAFTPPSAESEVAVVESDQVRARVQENLDLGAPPPEASADVVGDTEIISISVRDENAENSATLANAYAAAYLEIRLEQVVAQLRAAGTEVQTTINELDATIQALSDDDPSRAALEAERALLTTTVEQLVADAAVRTGGAAIVLTATTPENPSEPTPAPDAAIAAVVGLVIGLMMVVVVEMLDDKVLTTADLHDHTHRPVLGEVSEATGPTAGPVTFTKPDSAWADDYRRLTANLLGLDQQLTLIQVTTGGEVDNSAAVAANVAVVLNRAGHKVALVDANVRRPGLHRLFGLDPAPGLTEVLDGSQPADVVNRVDVGGPKPLAVYTAGSAPTNSADTLLGTRVARLFKSMAAHYDAVVVDSAAVGGVPDALALTPLADGVLLVVGAGQVSGKQLDVSLQRLHSASANVIGGVLSHVDARLRKADGGIDDLVDQNRPTDGDLAAVANDEIVTGEPGTEGSIDPTSTDPLVASERVIGEPMAVHANADDPDDEAAAAVHVDAVTDTESNSESDSDGD